MNPMNPTPENVEPSNMATYHPDPEINELVTVEANEAEVADLAAGYPPRWWKCPDCGASHQRGWFGTVGSHRCLRCGYAGGGGIMADNRSDL